MSKYEVVVRIDGTRRYVVEAGSAEEAYQKILRYHEDMTPAVDCARPDRLVSVHAVSDEN